jgi:hypothetical protein
MSKGFLLFLFAVCVLAGSPSMAGDLSATASPLFLTSIPAPSCAPMSSAAMPILPELMPQPEERVILCGACSDFACVGKRPYRGCSVSGELSSCQPGPVCEGEANVQCSCEPL